MSPHTSSVSSRDQFCGAGGYHYRHALAGDTVSSKRWFIVWRALERCARGASGRTAPSSGAVS